MGTTDDLYTLDTSIFRMDKDSRATALKLMMLPSKASSVTLGIQSGNLANELSLPVAEEDPVETKLTMEASQFLGASDTNATEILAESFRLQV